MDLGILSYVQQNWSHLIVQLIFISFGAFIGVFLGFISNNLLTNRKANKTTESRLHTMYLELNHNIIYARELLENSQNNNENFVKLKISQVFLIDAESAFSDNNIHKLVSPVDVMLMQNYIENGKVLDQWNKALNRFAESFYYNVPENDMLKSNLKMYREKIGKNAASFCADCYLLQERLKEYFDKSIYTKEKVRKEKNDMEIKIRTIKEKLLKGEFKSSKNV